MQAPSEASVTANVIIVGAGFGGCHALYEVRRRGFTAKILDAGTGFGGVWQANRYPGVRVDSETPLYQLSASHVADGFNFSERFSHGSEILRYFEHLDAVLDLAKDTIFNAAVCGAEYDEASNSWTLTTESGLTASCRHVIFAAGSSNKAYIPAFANRDAFEGPLIHPARWPEGFAVEGKRIGIIGQGASGLQIVQELAKKDCALTVFVRTPVTALPMRQRSLSEAESEQAKNYYSGMWWRAKHDSDHCFAYNDSPGAFGHHSAAERQALYEKHWARGGFCFLTSGFREVHSDKEANAEAYAFWAAKVRARVSDPAKRDVVAPLEQHQWFATKRPSLETDYYEMIDRPNVRVVDLKRTAIREFARGGVVTDDGETHELDAVVVATGYDAVTGSLYGMNIRGRGGVLLQDRWREGIATHLGMMAPGLPNAFFLYGPQAPTSLANGPPFLEMQVEWVTKVLERARSDGIGAVEASDGAAAAWGALSARVYDATLFRDTPTWYNGSNIPGKRLEPLIWFGGVRAWWAAASEALAGGWDAFAVTR